MNNKHFLARATRLCAALLALTCFSALSAHATPAADEADVRNAVEQAFGQLRTGDYNSLYDVLPTASQRRLPRETFVRKLEQTRNLYELDRLEIGAVHVAGDVAVVDSVVYMHARRPFEAEGKIVLRQYLVREAGRWRVTTGDRAAINPLLATNRAFTKRYPPTQPRIYVKRDGKWQDIAAVMKNMRPPAKR
ncbi:MAG TPA: hypothetical protein VE775_07090 [Pyrinomonadaceae bacterium]|nr:hypothetical protein [Pyrinomonadaceae bacterium]